MVWCLAQVISPSHGFIACFQGLCCDYLGKLVKCEELTCLQYADVMHFWLFFISCKNATAVKIVRGLVKHIHGCKPTKDETKNQIILMVTVK